MSSAEQDGENPSTASGEERPQQTEQGAGNASRIVVRCAGRTAVGQVRDHNEDNFVVANLGTGQIRPRDQVCEDEVGDRGLIFAVCDGMGGAAAGEVASQMAVDILVEAMRRGGPPKNRDGLARRLVSAVEEAGRRIFDAAQKERSRRGMGTTSTVGVLVDKVLFLAEVGDSRAYLLRRGQLKQLTKDQSLVNQLIEAGHLTEDEAEAFEHSNIILQALGTSETVQVDLTFVELRRGDRLMMCSDGLSGLVHAETLRTTLEEVKDSAECSAKLIEYAETAGGHDNITVVVADFNGEGLAEAFESDSFGYVQYPLPLAEHESGAFVDEDTTGPGEHRRRSNGDADTHVSEPVEQDRGESLLPLSADGGDPRANLLWIIGGVLALALAGLVWFTLEPMAKEDTGDDPQAHSVVPGPERKEPEPSASEAAQTAGSAAEEGIEEVDVNVHTDVENASLVVNGETKGDLSPEQSRSLKLRPGAYRFEAHSGGNQVAVTVVTVRGDTPMDVFLEMPKGASEKSVPAPSQEAVQPAPAKRQSETAGEHANDAARRARHAARKAEAVEAAPPSGKPQGVDSTPAEPKPAQAATSPQHDEHALPQGTSNPPPAAPRSTRKEPAAASLPTGVDVTAQRTAPAAAPAQKPAAIPDNPF